jgi:hypothetical protein
VTRESHLVASQPSRYSAGFAAWLVENWHVWRAFCRHADVIRARGHRHYSARTIVEVLRHESAISEAHGRWKLNNNAAPDLARLYEDMTGSGLFEFRDGGGRAA